MAGYMPRAKCAEGICLHAQVHACALMAHAQVHACAMVVHAHVHACTLVAHAHAGRAEQTDVHGAVQDHTAWSRMPAGPSQ